METIVSVKEIFNTFEYESCTDLLETIRSHLCYKKGGVKFCINLLDDLIASKNDKGLQYGDILEFQGPYGSGKRHLLYFIASTTLLPKVYESNDKKEVIGGLEEGIVLLDCSRKWQTFRLEEIMYEKIKNIFKKNQNNTINEKDDAESKNKIIKNIIKESLSRLYIFRPENSISLIATLKYLPHYFKSYANDLKIRYVFLDSISAFYWKDRYSDLLSNSSLQEQINIIYKRITQLLKKFCYTWCSLAISTNWVLQVSQNFNPYTTDIRYFTISEDSFQIYHHHLPLSYTSQVSHRICFLRKAVAQFSPGIDLENLLIYSQQRNNILQLGLYLAVLQRLSNKDLAPSKRTGFIFRITKDNVQIEKYL
ncbi:hypothetical protein PNEG_01889 [Pneumocystis murina B123]|uniref:DNA recombination and repair protein Rad51-like C-terminal domain-containing protein n=1 Tax=Pneumocystis murina (strain B123) TaxID=1069680 RepID=M7NR21_PNEMU|nr:hypothetical protein PNEG_01889 [Pneumocystis murina B123]EMR09702.1 hypothetical protein PNEG_01889 [Pneumocystis murina B123]